jgi:hypothetical protein
MPLEAVQDKFGPHSGIYDLQHPVGLPEADAIRLTSSLLFSSFLFYGNGHMQIWI